MNDFFSRRRQRLLRIQLGAQQHQPGGQQPLGDERRRADDRSHAHVGPLDVAQILRLSKRCVKRNTSVLQTSMQRPQFVQSPSAMTGPWPALPFSGITLTCGSGHTA